jgi:phenylacetate-CoA ligase
MAIEVRQDEYFDELETMPPEAREKYFNEKLAATVTHGYQHAPVVKTLLDKAGVKPGDLRTVKDLEKLPVTRKTDLLEMQKQSLPYGGVLAIPIEDVERVFISPGPIYEIQPSTIKFFAKTLWAAGFRKGDVVINTFTYHMSPAGILFHEGIRDCGATVVVAGTGNTDLQIQIMKDLKVTGFVGTPSFLMTVINRAVEMGYDVKKDLSIKRAWFTGEMLAPSLRVTFEGDYDIDTYQAYAVTEPGGCIAYECSRKAGMHFMDDYIIEIADPETGKQLGPGEIGEIVVTPVHSPDWGLVRFGTGDMSSYITEPCPCGRTSYRLTGMFVVAKQAEQAITGSGNVAAYQLVVERPKHRDEMTLKLELKDAQVDRTAISGDINRKFQNVCRIKIDKIEFVEPGAIPEDKRGIIDERKWE